MVKHKMISVIILTKNEAADLPACLASVSWSDDVHVFDSGSTDLTQAIARAAGASVHERAFTNYADQRNAALTTVRYVHDWVLILDADERVPPALAEEMGRFVTLSSPIASVVAARLRRRDFLFGRWLKHAQISPFYIRLVRPKKVHYEREINEVLVPHGAVVDLVEPFDHFPFSKGISHWIDKHNGYSTMEAQRAIAERRSGEAFSWKKAFLTRDFNVRRYHQKGLFYRLPGRPLIKLVYMLVFRRAILDGRVGIIYSLLQVFYEYFIVLKEREIEWNEGRRP